MNSKCTILVTSCKGYADVLEMFEYQFQKMWPDCPFPVVLNVDEEITTHMNYDAVFVSHHKENVIRMRDVEINTPYVIMMQEDHWLFDKVDNDDILNHIHLAEKYQCGYMHLIPDPVSNIFFDKNNNLMNYEDGTPYRISARAGLWKTEYFKKFADEYDELRELERDFNNLSSRIGLPVLGTKYCILPICDAVRRGKYVDVARLLLERAGVEPKRGFFSHSEKVREDMRTAIYEKNPKLILKIQSTFKLGMYKQKYSK